MIKYAPCFQVRLRSYTSVISTSSEFQTSVANRYSGRIRWAVLLSLVALVAALPLIYLYVNTTPLSFDTTVDGATVHFETNTSRLLYPSQCVTLKWDVEHIKAVMLNDRASVGHDSWMTCNADRPIPNIWIIMPDDTEHVYKLPVERL